MKLTYSKYLPVILATLLAAGSVMASETSDKGVDLDARQSQRVNKKSAPILHSPGSRGNEGHGAGVATPGVIPPGSRGNEGGSAPILMPGNVGSSGTTGSGGQAATGSISPGSRGNEGGGKVCPQIGIVCKAGEKAVYEPNSCKQSCVAENSLKCPMIAIVCKAGERAIYEPNSCKQSCVAANDDAKVCPMMAIVCKAGEHALMDANCKQSCVQDAAAGTTTQPQKRVLSNPAY